MPPTEPLAVFHLAEEGAFSEGLVQAARVPDDGRGFIVVLDDDLRTRQMRDCRAAPVARPSRPRDPTPNSKVATHLTVLQGMPKEPRPRYQPRLNILGCFALLHGLRTGNPQIPSTIRRD